MSIIDRDYSNISIFHKYAIMLCGYGFVLWNVNESLQPFGLPIAEIGKWMVIIIAVILPIKEIVLSKKNNVKVLGFSVLGLAYISLAWGLMISLYNLCSVPTNNTRHQFHFQYSIPIILIASIWINDTMAYLVGSIIGKNPLSKISPKKTWEGTIGGAILAVVVVGSFFYFFIDKNYWYVVVIIALIAAVIGTLGDLLESKLKRMANVKDSGSFMPGHGGFLDRFDSLILATPIVWLFLFFL